VSGLDPNGGGALVVPGGGSSGTHTSGTLAARPASPAAGDTYAVTSGAGTGDVYGCDLAGAWRLLRASARPLDANHVYAWRCDDAAGSTSIAATAGGAAMTLTGSAWVFGEPRLYRETGCATMEAGCAAADRATASITMPSGSLTVECDFSLHPSIAITDGASQAPLLHLRNTDDSRRLYVMLSWSGAAGLYAGMNADGTEFGTNSTRVLSTLRLGYSVPRHLGVVLDTAATALMIYVDGQLYVTQVNAHAVGFGSTGWTASIGSALGNTATPLSIGNLLISNVARDAAYMRAAHAALRGRQ